MKNLAFRILGSILFLSSSMLVARDCFVCAYHPHPRCREQKTKERCHDLATEIHRIYKSNREGQTMLFHTCEWRASEKRCVGSYEHMCTEATLQRKREDRKVQTAVVPVAGDPSGGLKDCSLFSYLFEGHGRGVWDFAHRIKRAVESLNKSSMLIPKKLSFEEHSCSTFANIPESRQILSDWVRPSLKEGQNLVASAQQALFSTGESHKFNFMITREEIKDSQPDECYPSHFSSCHSENESTLCWKKNGITRQICCWNEPLKRLLWRVGVVGCN